EPPAAGCDSGRRGHRPAGRRARPATGGGVGRRRRAGRARRHGHPAGASRPPARGRRGAGGWRGAGQGAGVWLWGGETTVRIEGPAGQGGRNQELALRVALGAQAAGWTGRWAFLSGGSDGRDGPTEAAGGIVGPGTIARIRAAGLDPEAHLARHDSLPALRAGGALLVTGETGTNVADFQILVRGAG
ncbi:MAG: MOFRL family protein, partial [Gemmobacter sp.]